MTWTDIGRMHVVLTVRGRSVVARESVIRGALPINLLRVLENAATAAGHACVETYESHGSARVVFDRTPEVEEMARYFRDRGVRVEVEDAAHIPIEETTMNTHPNCDNCERLVDSEGSDAGLELAVHLGFDSYATLERARTSNDAAAARARAVIVLTVEDSIITAEVEEDRRPGLSLERVLDAAAAATGFPIRSSSGGTAHRIVELSGSGADSMALALEAKAALLSRVADVRVVDRRTGAPTRPTPSPLDDFS